MLCKIDYHYFKTFCLSSDTRLVRCVETTVRSDPGRRTEYCRWWRPAGRATDPLVSYRFCSLILKLTIFYESLLTLKTLPYQWVALDTAILRSLLSRMLMSVNPFFFIYLLWYPACILSLNIFVTFQSPICLMTCFCGPFTFQHDGVQQ